MSLLRDVMSRVESRRRPGYDEDRPLHGELSMLSQEDRAIFYDEFDMAYDLLRKGGAPVKDVYSAFEPQIVIAMTKKYGRA